MQTALRRLLDQLERIGDENDELFDSEVREAMGEALFLAIVKGDASFTLPTSYGLSSPEMDERVAAVLAEFVHEAGLQSKEAGLDTFHKRLAAFQDPGVHTEFGNDSEEFFGATDPSLFDEDGNIKSR